MTRSFPRSLAATLAALCIVLASCGEDENPAAVDSPCDDASTTCLTIRLTPDQMTHSPRYDAPLDYTSHILSWDASSHVIHGYAPGQRVMVTVIFDPPLKVRYDHSQQDFSLGAGAIDAFDGFAFATTSLESYHWAAFASGAYFRGGSGTEASHVSLSAFFRRTVAGEILHSLSFDFVVPDAYTDGDASGTAILPGDLGVLGIQLNAVVDGDTTNDPPVWQGDFVPASTTARTEVMR